MTQPDQVLLVVLVVSAAVLTVGCGASGYVFSREMYVDHPVAVAIAFACTWPIMLAVGAMALVVLGVVALAWLATVVVLGLPIGLVQAIRGKRP